jgi:hypothetical protein
MTQPTPESSWQPTTRRDAVRRPLDEGFTRHTAILRAALWISTGLAGLGMLLALWPASAAADLQTARTVDRSASPDALVLAQQVNAGHVWVQTLALLLTAGVWLTWEQTLAASARIHPTARRRGPEAHVMGWLLPGLGLYHPVQGIGDLWRGVHVGTDACGNGRIVQRGDPERDPAVSPLVGLWWGLWIGAAVLWWIAGPLIAMFSAWDEGPGYWIVRSLGQGLLLAAGVAAGLLVRRLDPQRCTPGGSAVAPTPAPTQAPAPLFPPPPARSRAVW